MVQRLVAVNTEQVRKLVCGMGEAVGSAINAANDVRDERIIKWMVDNVPGAAEYAGRLRDYMSNPGEEKVLEERNDDKQYRPTENGRGPANVQQGQRRNSHPA